MAILHQDGARMKPHERTAAHDRAKHNSGDICGLLARHVHAQQQQQQQQLLQQREKMTRDFFFHFEARARERQEQTLLGTKKIKTGSE
jgi:antirestriction protein